MTMDLDVEEQSIRNGLVVTVPSFKGITAFATKERLAPLRTELAAHQAIGPPLPDLLKRFLIEVPKNILLLRIIGARTDLAVPVNSRVVPQILARVSFDTAPHLW